MDSVSTLKSDGEKVANNLKTPLVKKNDDDKSVNTTDNLKECFNAIFALECDKEKNETMDDDGSQIYI